jgi:hypothetical protein
VTGTGIAQLQAAIRRSVPGARTMWEFFREYRADDRETLLLNAFAVGYLDTGCSGAMISPHLFLTAAHCGGPGWTGAVRFFHIDEDAQTPGPAAQALSGPYRATSFPWQSWESPEDGGGDTTLWWLEDGPDGVPPGIKYGRLEISGRAVAPKDGVYSIWVNPVDDFRGAPLGNTLLFSAGTAGDAFTNWYGPAVNYALYTAGGASGSSILGRGEHEHRIVGVTSGGGGAGGGEGTGRNASRTRDFRRRFDADGNGVLDAIEYDWLFTRAPRDFYRLRFDTAQDRSLWQIVPAELSGQNRVAGAETREPGFWVGRVTGGTSGTADGLWHLAARFLPGATYRISVAARGTTAGQSAYLRFRADSAPGDDRLVRFRPGTDFGRLTERVTLGNRPDYRVVVGTDPGGTLDLLEVALVREGATLGFGTDEERRSWEYAGASYPTAWGIGGAGDFAGVVVGPSPGQGWGLRNRHVALRAGRRYRLTFSSQHAGGDRRQTARVTIRNLAGTLASESTWVYATDGQRREHDISFGTGTEPAHTLTFGTTGAVSFMVDSIRLTEL